MATQILNSEAATATRTLQIESRQLIPGVLPTIAVGDILNVTVRQNPENGQGSLYFKGLLIKAQLPANVQPGDKLQAKVIENGDQIHFKIVTIDPQPAASEVAKIQTPTTQLAEKLTAHLKAEEVRSPATLFPIQISDKLAEAGAFQGQIANILSSINSPQALASPKEALETLLAATKGELPATLKETAQAIRTFVEKNSPPPASPQILALRERISTLLDEATSSNQFSAKQITSLVESLQKDLKEKRKIDPRERDTLKQALDNLQDLEGESVPARIDSQLQQTLQRLSSPLIETDPKLERFLNPQAKADLLGLASRLDQMANTQEMLNQLNPLMQAMGEPALILLPFLFQGLLTHSEVTVESWSGKGEKEGSDAEAGGKKTKKTESFRHVEVKVPLSSLGDVGVNIAYRTNEIMVRFSLADKAGADFLHENLQELATLLKAQGFGHAELVTHVGEIQSGAPDWSLALHAATSVIA